MRRKFLFCITALLVVFSTNLAQAEFFKGPIVFAIDTSGSMKDGKIVAVKKSVIEIIRNLQPDQPISIITFNQQVNLLMPPTLDKELAIRNIETLTASGDTSMFDAIVKALNIESSPRPSQVVVLSDGADTTSQTKLTNLLATEADSKIKINTIGVQVSNDQKKVLEDIARNAEGGYYDVQDINSLIETYKVILEKELSTPTPSPTSIVQTKSNFTYTQSNLLFEISISALSSLLVFLIFLTLRKNSIRREYQSARIEALQKYSFRNVRKIPRKIRTTLKSYEFIPRKLELAIKYKLELIHSDFQYENVIRLLFYSGIVSTIFLTFVLKSFILSIVITIFLIPLSFNAYINSTRNRQIVKFSEELPELLNILASALRSGLTLPQGLEAYSSDSNGEVARQIRRAIGEIRVGTPIDEALMGVADRMSSEDLRWAVTALSIQRIVGGSMATILTTTYETVKSRTEIRREVKTLAAEGKLSAYVLMALPIGIFSFLFITRREYVSAFWKTPGGLVLATLVVVSLSIGWTWMKKIVDIKI